MMKPIYRHILFLFVFVSTTVKIYAADQNVSSSPTISACKFASSNFYHNTPQKDIPAELPFSEEEDFPDSKEDILEYDDYTLVSEFLMHVSNNVVQNPLPADEPVLYNVYVEIISPPPQPF